MGEMQILICVITLLHLTAVLHDLPNCRFGLDWGSRVSAAFAAECRWQKFYLLHRKFHCPCCRSPRSALSFLWKRGRKLQTYQIEIQDLDWDKWIHHNCAMKFSWLLTPFNLLRPKTFCWQRSICWPETFKTQVADPAFLKVSPLSPDFLHRQVCECSNKFVHFFQMFFAVSELDIIWVDCEIARGKVEKSSRCSSSPLAPFPHFSTQVLSLRWSPLRELAALGLEPGPLRPPGIQATSGRPASAQSAGITNSIWDMFISSKLSTVINVSMNI